MSVENVSAGSALAGLQPGRLCLLLRRTACRAVPGQHADARRSGMVRRNTRPTKTIQLDRTFISARVTASGRDRISRCGCACPCRCAARRRPPSCTPSGRRSNAQSLEAYITAKAENRLRNETRFQARLINRIAGHHDTSNLMGRRLPAGRRLARLYCYWSDTQPYTNRPDHPILRRTATGYRARPRPRTLRRLWPRHAPRRFRQQQLNAAHR